LYWCSVLSIIFCSMFYAENWIVVRVELTNAILWRCCFAIDCVVKMLLWECTWCFLYILVFALYVQNRKSFCHCRTQLRRCKSFKPCWFVAYVKKNVFVLQASQRHDQDSWCRIFFDTTCDGWIACVTFFLHETYVLLVSLFYGKCYVTMFIREYVAFSYR